MNSSLIDRIRTALQSAGDPDRSVKMQAYMKSEMPFHGVSASEGRRIAKTLIAETPLRDFSHWTGEVLTLWRGARYREERYAAIELTADPRARGFQTVRALPMYEEMIVTGAWWDYVDPIAAHRFGAMYSNDRAGMRAVMLRWSGDENFWKRRSAIISQLSLKDETDSELLFEIIEPSLSSREFFLRKAIGWSLRQYARTEPDAIRRYVQEHEKVLSPLSRREALKHL